MVRTSMRSDLVQIKYNRMTYRWEIWPEGESLPDSTHTSRDQAIVLALHLLREAHKGQVLVYNDSGHPESVLDVQNASRELLRRTGFLERTGRLAPSTTQQVIRPG